ncbi:glutamate dehydrogenase [Mariprofundus micogutta]|uniref:Glutamate dehydrogenase n=1 Tax=Mariprofundus micogutta TaxID=1921010 RepID=A0A1L8CMP0_9PROT|nr:NAD-glutamate dehydrogenase domain-containing protein [Mariprofundus micogutta]GAV20166.1 glutamate dehydrogenase [Mariprofundus micogutta]
MRQLRHQLIDLLDQARRQHRMDPVQPRLMAALVQDFLSLLPKGKTKRVAMHSRSLSHGNLYRHIFTIRCPDQAFYLDAIKGYLLRQGIQPIGQQTMVARMACGPEGCELELRNPDIHDEDNFMFIALHISATMTPDPEPLRLDIQAILQAVDLSVSDFMDMRKAVAQCIARLMPEKSDAAALLDWMNDNHFLYFGVRHSNKRLGLLKNKRVINRVVPGLSEEIESAGRPREPGVAWTNLTASQHYLYSAASIEVVHVCWTGPDNQMDYATIVGHFSRSARFANASYLPILASGWRELSSDPLLQHSAFYRREIRTLFDRIPKRILLATRASDWLEPLKAIIDLADPLQLVAEIIPSLRGNLDTLLIAITANRFGPVVMQRIIESLDGAGIKQHGYESFGIGPHRIVLVSVEHEKTNLSRKKLNELIRHSIIFWKDIAKAEVLRHANLFDIPETLQELASIPSLYQDLFPPAQFIRDVQMRRRVLANGRTCVHVTSRANTENDIELHIYSVKQPSLGNLVDIIRSFGLDPIQESLVPFGRDPECIKAPEQGCGCIHISSLTCHAPLQLNSDDATRLRRGLAQVLNGEADHDPINALLVLARMTIDEVAILITLRNHLIQLLPDAAKLPLSDMMLRHANVSAYLQQLFAARHITAMSESFLAESRKAFHEAMLDVASLSDDRWFRALAELVESSLRTNAYIRETGTPIGIKIAPRKLSFAPQPKPFRELFVHGVHVEGVHLRAGPIARGGLRYSDRPSDFRTEVLELMSTQVVKNGQIVPTGSKGGFVIRGGKGPEFVLAQYRAFIRTMLALTDNLVAGESVPPAGMVIAEEDRNDPYFVVAADKGTARYSDDANDESQAAGFWLDDAFASGGRHGYDHKVVGITARGAWVCAAHLFEKLGVDAYRDPVSCVSIGDMGGDVFGNGMLLNPELKLIAAFNHQHIFLDPNPDSVKAFAERKRLFATAGGWDKHETKLISKGGGIFERSSKQITLAPAVRQALGIEEDALSGEALIRAILSAPVDLLYNGGIGTYVKASSETHPEVRDPVNNAVRVNASDLRCRVVCEGGNLGFTQKSRIEYAVAGGLINTDATDNSAGVDMSDHEVNLKILLSSIPDSPLQGKRRNKLLESLTEAVTEQCLNDNLMQSRCLTLSEYDTLRYPPRLQRLRDGLINQGWLDENTAPGINNNDLIHLRPLLSIFLGQEKNRIHAHLSQGDFHRISCFAPRLLQNYFPAALHRKFGSLYINHPLAADIIQTQAANHVVNHIGLCAVHHLETMVNASTSEIVEALLIAETVLDLASLREAIWQQVTDVELATCLQHELQQQLMLFSENLLRLCSVEKLDLKWAERQKKGLCKFRDKLAVPELDSETLRSAASAGLDEKHLHHLSLMPQLAQSACAVHLASSLDLSLSRCLEASRICLEILPIDEMEQPLRSPEWADDDAHKLRREWLHRLTLLQNRAIAQLLEKPGRHFEQAGENLWKHHRHWPDIELFKQAHGPDKSPPEIRRMRLLLALTRLESIVEKS